MTNDTAKTIIGGIFAAAMMVASVYGWANGLSGWGWWLFGSIIAIGAVS